MITFSHLEVDVMEKLLEGESQNLAILRDQFHSATIEFRRLTGTGFLLRFRLPNDAKPASMKSGRVHVGDVEAEISGLANGAGFVLFIKDGKIEILEGYSYEEKWPDYVEEFILRYLDINRESLSKVGL